MKCSDIKDLLSSYANGELTFEQKQPLEEHVSTCTACRDMLARYYDTRECVMALSSFPYSPDIEEQVITRIKNARSQGVKTQRGTVFAGTRFNFTSVWKPALAIVTVVALTLALLPVLSNHPVKLSAADIALSDPQVRSTFTPYDLAHLSIQEADEGGNQSVVTLSCDTVMLVLGVDMAAKKVSQWLFDSNNMAPVNQPGKNYQLIFTSNLNGLDSIFMIKTDGSGLIKLTDNAASYRDAVWSSHSQKIAFDSARDTDHDDYPVPSHNRQIYSMNPDGTTVTMLTWLGDAIEPEWSPDGTMIAFAAIPEVTREMLNDARVHERNPDNDYEIYVMNADGSNLRRLTDNYVTDGKFTTSNDLAPQWSPDGKKIAFWSYVDGNGEIYVINTDGTGLRNLTDNPASDANTFVWAPDSQKIVFTSDRSGVNALYVMNADGSGVTKLTRDQAEDVNACWSPDGQKIAFGSKRDGNCDIYTVNPDGTGLVRLTNTQVDDYPAAWSPDGRQIAYYSKTDGNYSLNIMDADGSDQVNLATGYGVISWAELANYPVPTVPQGEVVQQPPPPSLWTVKEDQALTIAKSYVPGGIVSQAKISVGFNPSQQTYTVEFSGISVTKTELGWESQVKVTKSGDGLALATPFVGLVGNGPYNRLSITLSGADGKIISLMATSQSQVYTASPTSTVPPNTAPRSIVGTSTGPVISTDTPAMTTINPLPTSLKPAASVTPTQAPVSTPPAVIITRTPAPVTILGPFQASGDPIRPSFYLPGFGASAFTGCEFQLSTDQSFSSATTTIQKSTEKSLTWDTDLSYGTTYYLRYRVATIWGTFTEWFGTYTYTTPPK